MVRNPCFLVYKNGFTLKSWLLHLFFPNFLWRLPHKNAVCLTFDDGPTPEITPYVLDVLKTYNVKAVFFCVGSQVRRYPHLFKRILDEGHEVGNHTFFHEHGWKTSATKYVNSIQEAALLIPGKLFRPPYGKANLCALNKIKREGYKTIMWSWPSNDFKSSMTFSKFQHHVRRIQPGDILLFHDNEKTANRLIDYLTYTINHLRENKITIQPYAIL